MHDPHFIARSRLWGRLFDLIPEEHAKTGTTIAVELNALYWSAIDANGSLYEDAAQELAAVRQEIQELKALAAAPIARSH